MYAIRSYYAIHCRCDRGQSALRMAEYAVAEGDQAPGFRRFDSPDHAALDRQGLQRSERTVEADLPDRGEIDDVQVRNNFV